MSPRGATHLLFLSACSAAAGCAGGVVVPFEQDGGNPDAGSLADSGRGPDSGADVAQPANEAGPDAASKCMVSIPATTTPNKLTSDPAATQNATTGGFTLHKTLVGDPGYGGYDVLYTGETASWTFAIPAANIKSATLVLSMDGDDHADVPEGNYSFTVWSDQCVYVKPSSVVHGTPFASPFTNWFEVTEPASPASGGSLVVTMSNTSAGTGPTDWIAVRWIELQIATQ